MHGEYNLHHNIVCGCTANREGREGEGEEEREGRGEGVERERNNYPTCIYAARGKVISRGWCPGVHKSTLFWNQYFISQNTHFQRSILTQIGFSSNSMASGTA